MKFRFIIVSTMDGNVTGTNEAQFAIETAECEDCFVIDTETNEWILSDNSRRPLYDAKDPNRP